MTARTRLFKNRDQAARFSPEDRATFRSVEVLVNRDRMFADYWNLGDALAEEGIESERVYLRFGELPAGRYSEGYGAHLEGVEKEVQQLAARFGMDARGCERGLSVFAGSLTVDGHYVIRLENHLLHYMILMLCAIDNRSAYFIRGETLRGNRSSRGSCGEPLMKRIRSVEPVPAGAIVGATRPSHSLEDWNRRRGAFQDRIEPDPVGTLPGVVWQETQGAPL